ncbi:MAG: MopE-related protein [Myxococcota bacterium]
MRFSSWQAVVPGKNEPDTSTQGAKRQEAQSGVRGRHRRLGARLATVRVAPAFVATAIVATAVVAPGALRRAAAQEPPECLSPDPADWPAPARPYFMLVVDTSGSMTACTTPPTAYPNECDQTAPGYQLNSCGLVPNRINDAKCALQQTVLAFGGQVNFGLSTFGTFLSGCNAGACVSDCGTPDGGTCDFDIYGCTFNAFPGSVSSCGNTPGCLAGAGPAAPNFGEDLWLNGGNIVVPMQQDPWWLATPSVDNTADLLEWFDGDCTGDRELFAGGGTPISGALQSAAQYLRAGWNPAWSEDNYCPGLSYAFPTPLDVQDRACRSVNVILVTDGDDTCNGQAAAEAAATDLFSNGVTLGVKNWPVRTHVIQFAGGNAANTDAIANAGGTGSSIFATNETQLAVALANIVAGAVQPEVCNNGDDNCNGCTDEGYRHYCNQAQTCCAWTTAAQRDTCLANYEASIPGNPPSGDLSLLPCTTAAQQADPATWLCFDPGDICDEQDNNCQDGVDEGQTKCGSPLACPSAEVCDGQDNDCDGQTDEGNVCAGCVPSPEVCDGCDNDCDGIADNPPPGGFPTLACGLTTPANCVGSIACQAPQAVPTGTCAAGAGYGSCTNNPQPEVCDGVDNNCNGQADEGIASTACVPPSHPPGLDYGPNSVCQQGSTACVNGATQCLGGVGPQAGEICNGIDDDCDGQIDEGPVFGEGLSCGINNPPCSPGTTACVNGALVCQGGVSPQAEVCDGLDNDCDGSIDDAPLADAPLPGQTGCWNLPGTCCNQQGLSWCPPPGGACNGPGALSAPCTAGTLTCQGSLGWACVNDVPPVAEVCDGADNNCNGLVDDGTLPNVGGGCGTNVGACSPGTFACVNGALDCVGDVGPTPETCNNIDDDCDGTTDNGVPAMGPCTPPYDTNLYPGPRTNPPCQPGVLECDGMGNFVCNGGVGPTPEVCDGLDNDCDANIDENGAQPDGIDGSPNPFPPPTANIGDACNDTQGTCEPGTYSCLNGLFACLGGQGPVFETCDCEDNDCDGVSDESPEPGEPPICSPGKDCIKDSDFCQCAEPCGSGEFPCPTGQVCRTVQIQGSMGQTAQYCVVDFETQCGDCTTRTVNDGDGNAVCAPLGTDPANCNNTPECVCKGPAGCTEPCAGVDCSEGKVCSNFGPNPGTCVDDVCYLTGCAGCDQACSNGSCLPNPCASNTCAANEVCKPTADFTGFTCVGSCAEVTCAAGEACRDGACVPTCNPDCPAGEVCDESTQTCVTDQCPPDGCPNGAYCDPVTGVCGDYPCEGVVCPSGQTCQEGDCFEDASVGTGGSAGSGGSGGEAGNGGDRPTGPGVTATTGAGGDVPTGAFGLPTGGGGCACEVAGATPARSQDAPWRWASWLGLLGAGIVRRRRRRRAGGAR